MPKYKERIAAAGIKQSDLLAAVNQTDPRVDKSLLSKIVNHVCLPTKPQFTTILKTLDCQPLDIYDRADIDLLTDVPTAGAAALNVGTAAAVKAGGTAGKSQPPDIYNLTVEISKDMAARVFSREALKKLGYASISDYIRQCVERLNKRYDKIIAKEKAAHDAHARAAGND